MSEVSVGEGRRVAVSAPATSANLGPGFDALGLALALRDDVVVEVAGSSAPRLVVEVSGEGADDVARDESHLVVRSMLATFDQLGVPVPRMVVRCTNRIPHGRGLGSSAAAVVAGVLAARGLVRARRDDEAVLALASAIEGHPDNAAACVLGGLTLAWQGAAGVRAVRLEPAATLRARVLVPELALSTEVARGMLPASVSHADAAHAAGRAALLVEAVTSRPDLLLDATEDRLHQVYRAPAMPETADLVRTLRARGHAAVVSGAGPSVLLLGGAGEAGWPDPPAGWRAHDLAIARTGAEVSALSDRFE